MESTIDNTCNVVNSDQNASNSEVDKKVDANLNSKVLNFIPHSFSSMPVRQMIENVAIVGMARTPIGSFLGSLSSVSATDLGAIALKGSLDRAKMSRSMVTEVILGNVLSAGLGQAPARQVSLKAGLPNSTICTTINKLCASGLKSVTLGAQSIILGHHLVVATGGMESMSNVPYLLSGARNGYGLGHQQLVDGILGDGLIDSKYHIHMGECGEETASKYNISRKEQDAYAILSYERAILANKKGDYSREIVPVEISGKMSKSPPTIVSEDEEFKRFAPEKFSTLKTVFKSSDGTITPANASKNSDGASAIILMDINEACSKGIKPLAIIKGYADAECDPKDFTIAPSLAIPLALERSNLTMLDISLFEINEAFSVVALVNQKILGIDPSKLNIRGGAVALGHPVGASGGRILISLIDSLKSGQFGCAAICNGGGGATAVIVEKL